MIALAGAAALVGFGYAFAHRSDARTSRAERVRRRPKPAPTMNEPRPAPPSPAPWQDADRISSSPDALDVALDLDGALASGIELTARPNDHVPAPRTHDDEDAPAPEDLGRAWLAQATESERSLGTADTLPDFEGLSTLSDELGETTDDDDETTAEYVRRHRISLAG